MIQPGVRKNSRRHFGSMGSRSRRAASFFRKTSASTRQTASGRRNSAPRIASQYHVPLSGRSRASSPRARTALFRICRLMDQSMEYSTAT